MLYKVIDYFYFRDSSEIFYFAHFGMKTLGKLEDMDWLIPEKLIILISLPKQKNIYNLQFYILKIFLFLIA